MVANKRVKRLPPLAELADTQIAEAARAAGEPEWLIERRLAAWQLFAESAPPIWKRTDLSRFRAEQIAAPLGTEGTAFQSNPELTSRGGVFTTLSAALHEQPELVKQYLGSAVDPLAHKFRALHAALWQDGIFLYVPKNVQVELPLLATFRLMEGDSAIVPHNLIIVERGASVTFIEEYVSQALSGAVLAAPATEIFIGEGATLRYVTAQTWGAGVYNIGAQRARSGRDSSLEWVAVNLGGQTQHLECETSLEGDGSKVQWYASTFADQNQSLLSEPWLRHVGANTEGHMEFKTVVDDSGYSTFDGMIKIEKQSRGTISRLEEHAIHLSPKARNDSIPGLKIDTNDVQRAGHASTSGQVDEEQLFYMLSRGIKRADAIQMIVMGFFEPVLERIPLEDLRERVTQVIEEKIR